MEKTSRGFIDVLCSMEQRTKNLDNDLEMVTVKHFFSRYTYSMWYEVELLREE